MKLKTFKYIFIACLLATMKLSAQSLTTSVLPAGGGTAASDGVQLNWTVGQAVVPATISDGKTVLTQGFQQPELQVWTGVVDKTIYPGSKITIPFKASGIISDNNAYIAELSDKEGNFRNPVVIGFGGGNRSGDVAAQIPSYAEPGTQYRVRIRSSLAAFTGVDNGYPLVLKNKLRVTVMPNPSTSFFSLSSEGAYTDDMQIRVIDIKGNVIEARQGLPAKGALQIGLKYRPGIYFVEVYQGGEKQVLKLNKLPD